jgi:hypothetical protein
VYRSFELHSDLSLSERSVGVLSGAERGCSVSVFSRLNVLLLSPSQLAYTPLRNNNFASYYGSGADFHFILFRRRLWTSSGRGRFADVIHIFFKPFFVWLHFLVDGQGAQLCLREMCISRSPATGEFARDGWQSTPFRGRDLGARLRFQLLS